MRLAPWRVMERGKAGVTRIHPLLHSTLNKKGSMTRGWMKEKRADLGLWAEKKGRMALGRGCAYRDVTGLDALKKSECLGTQFRS